MSGVGIPQTPATVELLVLLSPPCSVHSGVVPPSSYLACPPGGLGLRAWTVALVQLNSPPAPGTCKSSPSAGQRSGG